MSVGLEGNFYFSPIADQSDRRISRLKEEFSRRIGELTNNGSYSPLSPTDDEDDLGIQLGLGGLRGLPASLEYEESIQKNYTEQV